MFNIAIHGHFYQPPRENPWLGYITSDPTAAPSHDWNERVNNECYRPNSAAKILGLNGTAASVVNNYAHLSFNFGPTLHKWIEQKDAELDRVITSSGKRAIAQCYNHIIMPLASDSDKKTQTIWGIKDFERRFKRQPKGIWLPETAVDIKTLEVLAAENISFTILAPRQCQAAETNGVWHDTPGGNGLDITLPYLCELPSGKSITIVFYHGGLAQGIAFGGLLENGDRFYDALLSSVPVKSEDRLLLVATDGETYGHHHKFGEMALARVFDKLNSNKDVTLPDIGAFIEKHPPVNRCRIVENTSWSCAHGVERWRSNCGCHTGGDAAWNQAWRLPLREAFDKLRDNIDELYEKHVSQIIDPWILRDAAADLFIEPYESEEIKAAFIKKLELKPCEDTNSLFSWLEIQRMRMFMYTSCGWFFNDISGVETKQVIGYALRAAELTESATSVNLRDNLLADLEKAKGNTQQFSTAKDVAKRVSIKNIVQQNITPYSPCKKNILCKDTDVSSIKIDESDKNEKKQSDGGNSMTTMNYGGNLAQSILQTMERDPAFRSVAYFSMEIGLNPQIPTYSGGLGVLAGDILKSAAEMGVPMVGVTLLYKKGYFAQKINKDGRQTELPVLWNPEEHLTSLPNRVNITMNGRHVAVAVWSYVIIGKGGHPLPIFFLDTDIPENCPEDRVLTAELYGGDNKYRLCQELILGIAGLRMLRDMGFRNIKTFHLNEGHAGFISLELLREQGYSDIEKVRNQVIFTTHTPVAAGHDFFSYDLINQVLERSFSETLERVVGGNGLSMTDLALRFSRYVNGVSQKHAEVSRAMFKNDSIDWVTNGVHTGTWTSPGFARLYDQYIPGWDTDPSRLMQAMHIPDNEIWKAHQASKMKLLALILEETGQELDTDVLTIGFARRAATYKRADLVFSDIERLLKIGAGKIQFIFSGKAHPHDEPGKDILQRIWRISKELGIKMPVVFVENYNMGPAKLLTAGVDLWLNTPLRPHEASGTSGMKCVHNGVMNFSVLDGWWIEGCIEDYTGWAIGPEPDEDDRDGYNETEDANDLYEKLEKKIIPTYYENRNQWIKMMKAAIAVNASYFNTHRVVKEYCEKAYGTIFRGH